MLEAWKNNTFHNKYKSDIELLFIKVKGIQEKCYHFVGVQLQPNQEFALPGMLSCTLSAQELLYNLSDWNLVFKSKLTNKKKICKFKGYDTNLTYLIGSTST